jgi:hypothetical protein
MPERAGVLHRLCRFARGTPAEEGAARAGGMPPPRLTGGGAGGLGLTRRVALALLPGGLATTWGFAAPRPRPEAQVFRPGVFEEDVFE